jgi:hypothetical protein
MLIPYDNRLDFWRPDPICACNELSDPKPSQLEHQMLGVGQTRPEFRIVGLKSKFMCHEENGVGAVEDARQTDEVCACNRSIGGDTLLAA